MATTTIPLLLTGTHGDNFCTIGFAGPGKGELTRTKTFMKFIIPEALKGVDPTAAVLSMYLTGTGTNAETMEADSTFDTWDASSTYANMQALDLNNYDTLQSRSVPATINAWYTWDVLGTNHSSSTAVRKALLAARSYVTLLFTFTGTPTQRYEDIVVLGNFGGTADNYKAFDVVNNGYTPYLTITHPAVGRIPVHSGQGGNFMF